MKFDKLRILGFKTFVEPTEFLIAPGLTGVVGPNGCGKSNLVEALRWVMGENSYKNMRASGMDDVIFAGSGHRPSRNTAEVTLFLDNRERRAPAGFNDTDALEVTRRIEREAGSVYRINGRDVRARDVQLLFADASTGPRSPAMVRQGQIGELIAAKPTQRRAILEEASGISGLHSRRHEAEIRLKAAEQNLERLEDVLVQIESQLENLKRQARQATRYRIMSSEIRSAEATIVYLRWLAARDQVAEAEAQLLDADKAVSMTAEVQARTAREQALAAHALPGLRDKEAACAAALQRLRLGAGELEAEERRIRERIAELERRLAQLAQDRVREENIARDMAAALAKLDEEERELAAANAEVETEAEDLRTTLAEREAALAASERDLSERQQEIASTIAARQAIDRTLADLAERARKTEVERATIAREEAELAERLGEGSELEEARIAVEDAAIETEEAESRATLAEETHRDARAAADAARGPLAEAERELQRLETEAKTLAKILNVGAADLWPPVIDRITVAAGFEAALGAALGDDLEASADEAAPVHWRDAGPADADPKLPDGITPLATYVKAPPVLARRLAQIGLVARADGPALQKRLAAGQRLVSREGDLWRWDGLAAAAEAPTAAAQRLASRNRLIELETQVEVAREIVTDRRADSEAKRQTLADAEAAERFAREAHRAAQKREADAREALGRIEREAGQVAARLSALREAGDRLAAAAEEIAASRVEAETAREDLPPVVGLEEALAHARAAVALDRAGVAEARAALQGASREAEMRVRRMEAIARERESWLSRSTNAESQLAVLADRAFEAEEERAALMERPGEIALEQRRLVNAIAEAEKARAEAADALAVAERAQAEADRLARSALENMAGAREAKVRAEERYEAARARRIEIEARIREAFDVAPPGLVGLTELKEGAPLPDVDGIERRLERVRQERERLGAVNLRAEDEAREIDERRGALTAERDDLIEAIKRLRQGIYNLNREARERLMAAFETVNNHFQALFTLLFGGGTAELQLVASDDPLEAGLEIMARPPGKKPSTMTLLSGGEQALTAMALIFAVFLTNPAPICVLDEVDAPLDDANVERYCDLLVDMTRQTATRFVVITHNPITMARMDRLFGVTMAERGVSMLVSVDLEAAERILEAV